MKDNGDSKKIMTVKGPIDPDELGVTLPHEHIYVHFSDTVDFYDGFRGLPDDDSILRCELARYAEHGGQSIVELTIDGIGRNPQALAEISNSTGLNVVMGCGWYRDPWYPAEALLDRRSTGELAEILIKEIAEGVSGSGIRPGIIGEIGTHHTWMSGLEERVHRAAARAALATGLSVTTHSADSPIGIHQLEIFDEEGLAPERVIVGHADTYRKLDYYLAILSKGAFLQFDNLGQFGEAVSHQVLDHVSELLDRGFEEQLLLSHDVCVNEQLHSLGGNGYTYLFETFIPLLRERGADESTIRSLTVANPRRALAF